MAEEYPVCWKDTRLVFGPLNNVYQELSKFESIVSLWKSIPNEGNAVWLGQENNSALVLVSNTTRPYGAACYTLDITRDVHGYPNTIKLVNK